MKGTILRHLRQGTPHLVGRRYCTACASERPADRFTKIMSANGKSYRWVCDACLEKRSESWIKRGRK